MHCILLKSVSVHLAGSKSVVVTSLYYVRFRKFNAQRAALTEAVTLVPLPRTRSKYRYEVAVCPIRGVWTFLRPQAMPFTYSAEREESRLTTFSHFSKYLCHTKRYEYKIHIKMILNLY